MILHVYAFGLKSMEWFYVWWTSCFTGSASPQNTRGFGKAARALCLPGRHLILIGVFVYVYIVFIYLKVIYDIFLKSFHLYFQHTLSHSIS